MYNGALEEDIGFAMAGQTFSLLTGSSVSSHLSLAAVLVHVEHQMRSDLDRGIHHRSCRDW